MKLKALFPVLLLMLSALAVFAPASHASSPSNQAVLYASASNACTSGNTGGTCSVTVSGTYGDLFIVAWQESTAGVATLSDTLGTTFTTVSETLAMLSYARFSTTSSDTITLTLAASSSGALEVFIVRGLFTDYVVTNGVGTGTGTALATASTSYTGFTWFCAASLQASTGTLTAGTSYSLIHTADSSIIGAGEYSITVASPTTFPATVSASATWYDAGACFARTVINPSDVQILQYPVSLPSTTYFYINEYQNSYLSVGFASSTPTIVTPVTVPQLDPTVTGSNLLTLYLGGTSYFTKLIPSTNTTFYVPNPTTASEYQFNVQDLSGTYGAGSSITFTLGTSGITMSSGYLDASNSFVTWLPAGTYDILLKNPAGTSSYSTTASLQAASGVVPVTINILQYSVSTTCGGQCELTYGAKMSGNDIAIAFDDASGTTTSINDSIYHTFLNGTTTRFYTKLTTGSYGSFTDLVACDTDACNSTITSQFYVKIIFSDSFGSNQVVTFPIGSGGLGSSIPFNNLPATFLGWSYTFGSVPPYDFVSLFLILLTAASFGAYASKFGAVVIAIETAGLSAMGWLYGVSPAMITLVGAFSVLAYIAYLEAGR